MMSVAAAIQPDVTTAPAGPVSARADRRRLVAPRDFAVAAGLTAAAVALTWDAWTDIYRLGTSREELGYVLLAPFVILWIAWVRVGECAACRQRGGWVGLVTLAAGYLVFWYGYVVDPVLWRAGAVIAAAGAALVALGSDVMVRYLPAFAATIFLVPVSPTGRYQVALPLQQITARATQALCDLLGIYVDRAGNLLTINGVDVTVAEACNGMRMILTLVLVCYAIAFALPLRAHVRFLLLAASPLVAVVVNVVRLVPTVWLFGNAPSGVANLFHVVGGWVMTVLAFLALMGFFRLLRRAGEGEEDEVSRARLAAGGVK